MRLNFYSHVSNVDVIKKAVIDAYNDPALSLNKTDLESGRVRATVQVNPNTATPADTYTFLEEFDEAFED